MKIHHVDFLLVLAVFVWSLILMKTISLQRLEKRINQLFLRLNDRNLSSQKRKKAAYKLAALERLKANPIAFANALGFTNVKKIVK